MDGLIGFSANSPYEPPENPDLTLDTGAMAPEEAVGILCDFIRQKTMAGKAGRPAGAAALPELNQ